MRKLFNLLMSLENLENWTEKKLEQGVNEEVIRDVLKDKGLSKREIDHLIEDKKLSRSEKKIPSSLEENNETHSRSILENFKYPKIPLRNNLYLTLIIFMGFGILIGGFLTESGPDQTSQLSEECDREFEFHNAMFSEDQIKLEFEGWTEEESPLNIVHYFENDKEGLRITDRENMRLEPGEKRLINYSIDLDLAQENIAEHEFTTIYAGCGSSISISADIGDNSIEEINID